jgi:ABC-2 type transport system ATP-binding protein
MDEAERCDRVVYINSGRIITRGTVQEVVQRSGLITFVIEGADVRQFLPQLEGRRGIEHVAFFGAALHVSGQDRALLEAALTALRSRPGIDVREAVPSLEDVFIHLQSQAGVTP